ncbi:MAG TPA: hypothetical protein VJP59_11540, partial [Gemmatimonadota bacterium]|nr:hypothetical protein [Gemmatimonadota bacterium]
RNDNPLPKTNNCSSVSAVVTTVTPQGAVGQPYLPATAPLGKGLFATDMHKVTLWLDKPGPNAENLLEPGSVAGVKILGNFGMCTPKIYAEQDGFLIPPPRPRIIPGSP